MNRLREEIIGKLDDNPVIAVIKDLRLLKVALDSSCSIIFLLTGNIFELSDVILQCRDKKKMIFLHVEKITGVALNRQALYYIQEYVQPDGIISSNREVVKISKEIGLFAIQRYFVVDSISLEEGINSIRELQPDLIEVLPGILGQVLYQIAGDTDIPVLSGGLIQSEHDVLYCLKNGALGISTTNTRLWFK